MAQDDFSSIRLRSLLSASERTRSALLHSNDPQQMARAFCGALVESGATDDAWIGIPGKGQHSQWQAGVGPDATFLTHHRVVDLSCARSVLASGEPAEVTAPADTCAGCALALLHADHTTYVQPLRLDDGRTGVMLASVPGHASQRQDERAFFTALAEDLAIGLSRTTCREMALRKFASGVAHDLANLVGVIKLDAMMAMRVRDNGRAPELVDSIREQLTSIEEFVAQLSDIGRRGVLEGGLCDLGRLVHDEMVAIAGDMPGGIAMEMPAEDQPLWILGHEQRLRRLVRGLGSLARDSMSGTGTWRIDVALVPRDDTAAEEWPSVDRSPAEWVSLISTDTGHGIAPGVADRLFEPFTAPSHTGYGAGMALADVAAIVELHGGAIHAENLSGGGTRVRILLPAAVDGSPDLGDEEPDDTPELEVSDLALLLVEDNAAARLALGDTLELFGYRTYTAAGAEEALSLFDLHADEIGLVITDLLMPGMDGAQLSKNLRALDPDIPIIIMSGYPLSEDELALRAGAGIKWLRKPIELEVLELAVSRILTRLP